MSSSSKIRLMVFRVPTNQESGGFQPFDLGSPNNIIDYINTEKFTPVYQKFISREGVGLRGGGGRNLKAVMPG